MTSVPVDRAAGLARWLPIVGWLPQYQRGWLRADVVAALTVWALVVPQAIAYGQIAGLPPQSGLFAAAAGLFAYALLGTSRQLVVSPTSSTAAISASLVAVVAVGSDPARFASLSAALALLVGCVFVVFSLVRLGFVSRFIPAGVSVGFMFGLGLTIMVGQAAKILGVPDGDGAFFQQVASLMRELGEANIWAIILGGSALVALLVAQRLAPTLPMALIVVVAGIVLVAVLGLTDKGVEVIGLVEGAVPMLVIPVVPADDLLALVPGAVAIAILGYAETNQVAEQMAAEHSYEIRSDQEMLAVGGSNLAAGLFQGFIVGGGASQSAANDRAGGRTALVSLIVAGLTVVTTIALLPLFQDLPQAVLGAIVISAVVGFLRVDQMRRLAHLRQDTFRIALFSLGAVLLLGILPGLILAVLLSLVSVLLSVARPTVSALGEDASGVMVAVDRHPGTTQVEGVLVLRLDSGLVFLNAGALRDDVLARVQSASSAVRVVILDLSMSPDLDVGSVDVLERLAVRLRELGVELRVAEVHAQVQQMLERAGLTGAPAGIRVSRTITDALGDDAGAG